jgi:hypothetical protein
MASSPTSRPNNHLPSILEGIRAIQTEGVSHFHSTEQSLSTASTRTAYELLVLLKWRVAIQNKALNKKDIWEYQDQRARLFSDTRVLENRINSVWNDFIGEYRTPKEIEDILWLQFPVDGNNHRFLRGMSNLASLISLRSKVFSVVDCIPYLYNRLLTDGLIDLSLRRTWKYGLECEFPSDSSLSRRFLQRYDAFGTPR